jgi:hypothetical protein
MKLVLQRTKEINNAVIGELSINDKFFCYTLEDKIRTVKIKHQTCIPAGTYKILLTLSQRFKTVLPILLNVPNFEGIRIHAGNTVADTSGCLLIGSAVKDDTLLHSKTTLEQLLNLMRAAIKKGEAIEIQVKNPIVEKPTKTKTPKAEVVEVPEVKVEIKPEVQDTVTTVKEILEEKPQTVEISNQTQSIIKQFLEWILKFIFKN